MEVVWSPQSDRDLGLIKAFYRDIDPAFGEDVIKGILSVGDRIEKWPKSGRMVPEINDPAFREMVWHKKWRIIYMLPTDEKDPIEILNIIHTSQQFGEIN